MRLPARLLTALVALVPTACAAGSEAPDVTPQKAPDPVLAVVWREDVASLVELEAVSLRPLKNRRVRLGRQGSTWRFSPDASTLALGGDGPSLRLVDLRDLRSLGEIAVRGRGYVSAIAWPTPDRILALIEWGAAGHAVVVVDPLRRSVVARRTVRGTLGVLARSPDGLVLLLGPVSGIGSTRLVVVRRDGAFRSIPLHRVRSGLVLPRLDRGEVVSLHRTPALAVDPRGDRALVVTPEGIVAEVGLRDQKVRYRGLRRRASLLERFREWLEPTATAKASDGKARTAVWLDEHLVAVTGLNAHAVPNASGSVDQRDSPAGLQLIDTRTWTEREVDATTSAVSVAGDLLLAHGAVWDSAEQRFVGRGLTAYGTDGRPAFHVFANEPVSWVQTANGSAYVVVERGRSVLDPHVFSVDLGTGRVLRDLTDPAGSVPQVVSNDRP